MATWPRLWRLPSQARNSTPSAPAAASESERRQPTVIFCDLLGPTTLSTGMDPEDLRDVIASFSDPLQSAEIWRYNGLVAKYM
jgi:class 3 adenylate cyclase